VADIVDPATRSSMMAGIKGKNTKPEMLVRRYLHRHGLRFRLHPKNLPGRPDLILPKYGTVVFVHGCFWHRHKNCRFAYTPKTHRTFWKAKLLGNAERDERMTEALIALGWRFLTIWECEITRSRMLERLVNAIKRGRR
jgi:DNA mismatch endonuclease, patch repair protein